MSASRQKRPFAENGAERHGQRTGHASRFEKVPYA
jgi:hypothetical protein